MIIAPRAAVLALLITAIACTTPSPGGPAPQASDSGTRAPAAYLELSEAARRNAGIVVAAAEAAIADAGLVAPGVVALDDTRTARIGSLQEGVLLQIHAEVGDRVRASQLLATMHGHAVHEAWAGYRKAIAERLRAEQESVYAVDAHARAARLYADKAISLQELQRADVDRGAAARALDIAQAEVTRALEELEHVGIARPDHMDAAAVAAASEQIPVRSPIAGVVLERLVTPGTTVTPGSPMFVVSDLSTVWAVAEIDETELTRLAVGRPVTMTVAAYPGLTFAGTITFVADTINPKTRRVAVRCTMPNRDGRLKPEMYASIRLGGGESQPVVVVPGEAVQNLDGVPTVFIETAVGRYIPRQVELGPVLAAAGAGERVAIRAGLAAGERVVVAGSFALKSELLRQTAAGE